MASISVPLSHPSAVVVGSAPAVNLAATGNLVLSVNNAANTTVALTSGDTPSAVVTKINTALGANGTATLVAGFLVLTSASVGRSAALAVVNTSNATVLTNLGLAAVSVTGDSAGNPAFDHERLYLSALRVALKALALGGSKGTLAAQAARVGVDPTQYAQLVNNRSAWQLSDVALVAAATQSTVSFTAA